LSSLFGTPASFAATTIRKPPPGEREYRGHIRPGGAVRVCARRIVR
jgi:hypothetical protein